MSFLISFITGKKSRGNDHGRIIKLWFLTISIIKIATHFVEERFEVLNPAILKVKIWVHDIAEIIMSEFSLLQFVENYQEKNPEASESEHIIPEAAMLIRLGLGLTQPEFSLRFGFDVRAVQDWEQKCRQPERAARVLLTVIAHEPEAVSRALAH